MWAAGVTDVLKTAPLERCRVANLPPAGDGKVSLRFPDRTGRAVGRARRPTAGHEPPARSSRDSWSRLRSGAARARRELARADAQAVLARAVFAPLDPARVARAVVERVASWMPALACRVVVARPGEGVRVLAAAGDGRGLDAAARLVAVEVVRSGRHVAVAELDPNAARAQPVAAVGLPLVGRDGVLGAIVILDREPSRRALPVSAVARGLRALVEPAGLALDTALRLDRAEALSVTDDLTQLYNSRFLHQALRREVKRVSRGGRPLSVLFVDMDGFKSVNDRHGHLSGSAALVEVGEVIRQSARETDVVSRFGGDEFALVLPETSAGGAVAVGERVRDRIAAHVFLAGAGLHVRLSASVGVATLSATLPTAESLLQAADRAMYWVKAHGKNGIHVAEARRRPRSARPVRRRTVRRLATVEE
jgi:diguanylate cyclase (GGDEF)-like protein